MAEPLKVSDVLSFVKPVKLDTPICEVAKLMKEEFTSLVPVVDDQGKLLGVIYAEDLLAPFIPEFFDLIKDFDYVTTFGVLDYEVFSDFTYKLFLAADVIQTNYVVLKPEDSILKAIFYFTKERRTCLAVVDREGNYKGVVSRLSILEKLYGSCK
uniref:CBS domain-containing protein n=1 Tax=candidate division WOR-3 bacterium TaxID=2052148 RepID=A0A7C2K264_UNCW3